MTTKAINQEAKVDKKHLYWIIPLTLLIGILLGMVIYSMLYIHSNKLLQDVTFSCLKELYNISLI